MKNIKWIIISIIIIIPIVLVMKYPDNIATTDGKASFLYYIFLLLFIITSVITHFRDRISFAIKSILAWACIIIVLVIGYSYRYELTDVKDRLVGELLPSKAMQNEKGEITVRKSGDGHFYIDTLINNIPVKFMIDTGATSISLSPNVARRIGIDMANLQYNIPYSTANGMGWGANVTLNKIEINDIVFHDVTASVNKTDMDTSLLGMSFLNRFNSYEVRQDKLILRR